MNPLAALASLPSVLPPSLTPPLAAISSALNKPPVAGASPTAAAASLFLICFCDGAGVARLLPVSSKELVFPPMPASGGAPLSASDISEELVEFSPPEVKLREVIEEPSDNDADGDDEVVVSGLDLLLVSELDDLSLES